MEQAKLYDILCNFEKGSFVNLEFDRGNGERKIPVRFDGFDIHTPLLYTRGGALLDIEKIGGYNSIISVEPVNAIV